MDKQKVLFTILTVIFINTLNSLAHNILPVKKPVPVIHKAACPTIISGGIIIQPATCNKSDGAIFRLTGTSTGKHTYTWYDSKNNIAGTDSVLMNVPAGQYTVTLQDESKCAAAKAGPFTIPTNTGIGYSYINTKITLTNCSNSDGAITGIADSGAVSLQWVNTADTTKILATTLDLTNIPLGIYKLKGFSAGGCETDTKTFYVGSQTVTPMILADTVTTPNCNANDGQISIRLGVNSNQPPINYYIVDSAGYQYVSGQVTYTGNSQLISTKCTGAGCKLLAQTGLDAGTYRFIVGDPKVCLITLKTYVITRPVFGIDTSQLTVTDDRCGKHVGVIGPVNAIGGTPTPPFVHPLYQSYIWYNDKGNAVGTGKILAGIGAGRYRVVITDIALCSATSRYYTVKDSTGAIVNPVVSAGSLCLPGPEVLTVTNATTASKYNLYKLEPNGDTTFVTEKDDGKFVEGINQTTTFFIAASNGTCESNKVPVTAIVLEPGVNIPNTFTPNNDGVNDHWNITGLSGYPNTTVAVYNRYGKEVYSSVGYGNPFDGTENGKQLPTGTYYYMIDLKKKDCGATSGSLTIIR